MTALLRARDNPFATSRLHALPMRLPGGGWPELIARLECLGHRGAIVGPHGAGKTQLLEELRDRLVRQGRSVRLLRLNANLGLENGRRLREFLDTLAADDTVLLDGAEQLGRWRWWRLERRSRRCRGLIVTMHRPGRLPTLVECTTSLALLDDLLQELLGADADAWRPLARRLFLRHQGNLRDTLRGLYDAAAGGR